MDPGTVLAVAQIAGALASKLFTFAGKVKSAKKDVQSVATDLCLFGPTLTSLHKTLEAGRQRGHVPDKAFENSLKIANECQDVFDDIQRETGIDVKLKEQDPSFLDRMRWAFSRQRQVELWQKRLESLKLSITVQISVMHFGEQVAGTSALRYCYYSEAFSGSKVNLISGAPDNTEMLAAIRAWKLVRDQYHNMAADIGKGVICPELSRFGTDGILDEKPTVQIVPEPTFTVTGDRAPPDTASSVTSTSTVQRPRPSSNLGGPFTMRYRATWTLIDRLEHAVRKTELLQWERNRLEENFLMRRPRTLNPEEVRVYMKRLVIQLRKFGLSTHVSTALADHLFRGHDNDAGMRFPFFRQPKDRGFDGKCMDELSREEWLRGISSRRWAPDILDDVLWESMCLEFGLLGDGRSDLVLAERSRREERLRQEELESLEMRQLRQIRERAEAAEHIEKRKQIEYTKQRRSHSDRLSHGRKSSIGSRRSDQMVEAEDIFEPQSSEQKYLSGEEESSSNRRGSRASNSRTSRQSRNWEKIVVQGDAAENHEVLMLRESSDEGDELHDRPLDDSDSDDSEAWVKDKARELLQQWTFVRPKVM